MSTKKDTTKAKSTTAAKKKSESFSAEEKAAVRERAAELKAATNRAGGEKDLLAKIAAMQEPDRGLAKRLHTIITSSAPDLWAKTWYGMPAYSTPGKDGKIICFFQPAKKFNTRYATLGFNDSAKIDEGTMWPVAYGLTEITPAIESKISALVKKAVS